jgi:tetratricopeptide (TPR) repeat protein
MATGRKCAVFLAAFVLLWSRALLAQGQGGARNPTLSRALDLEGAGRCAEAFPAYRQALGEGEVAGALTGLERCAALTGRTDTLLAIIDSVLLRRARDPVARAMQLRVLMGARRFDQARLAFHQWVQASPRDAAPYREYARRLIDAGWPRAADTVLQTATRALGSPRDVAAEIAELRATLGMWEASAQSWRDAMALSPFLVQSAIFVLAQAPATARDSIRAVLAAPPAELRPRQILAGLEIRWRSARDAWAALEPLPPSDSVVRAWQAFAADAEQQDAWLTARDAYLAVLRNGTDRTIALRAASAALQGRDAASALELIDRAAAGADSAMAPSLLLLRVRALSQLGRPQEADSALATGASVLDPDTQSDAVRAIAWGWVRLGDLQKARAALARTTGDPDERATAWIALYEGDLKTARAGLRRIEETSRDAVLAMALLARTRAEFSSKTGDAFLALARADTLRAARLFEEVSGELRDATPLLLGIAARLFASTPDSVRSLTIWRLIVEQHPTAPEAAESELEWARTLRRQGNRTDAIARLEHLILTYPQSALVPQARRELELVKNMIPPAV